MWSDQHNWLHRMGFNFPKRTIKSSYLDAVSVVDNVLLIEALKKCITSRTRHDPAFTWPLVMCRSEKLLCWPELVGHSLCSLCSGQRARATIVRAQTAFNTLWKTLHKIHRRWQAAHWGEALKRDNWSITWDTSQQHVPQLGLYDLS